PRPAGGGRRGAVRGRPGAVVGRVRPHAGVLRAVRGPAPGGHDRGARGAADAPRGELRGRYCRRMESPEVVERRADVESPQAVAPAGAVLGNDVVRLTPLTEADADELFVALNDERVWAAGYGGGPQGRPPTPRAMTTWIAA